MGTQILAKRAGTCPACNNAWKTNENIYWDSKVKNSSGFSVTCTDQKCFSSQGGTITPRNFQPSYKSTYPSRNSYREREDVTATLPDDYESNPDIDKAANTVLRVITKADKIASDMYPNLQHNTNTFGQIRSKLADQILAVYNNTE